METEENRQEEKDRGKPLRKLFVSIHMKDENSRMMADKIKAKFSKKGYFVVTPFDLGLHAESTFEEELWYRQQEVLKCHALYLAPGWGSHPECSLDQDTARAVNQHRQKSRRKPIQILFGTQRLGWVSRKSIEAERKERETKLTSTPK